MPRAPLPPYAPIADLFASCQAVFTGVIDAVEALAGDLARIGPDRPPEPRWDQGWFAPLDAAVAYALVRTRQPARIVEVGSGHSTRFLARAVADGALATTLTSIDPQPRAVLGGLRLTAIRTTVQAAGLAPFAALQPGDMLFIDSSHIALPGTDLDHLVARVLPGLPAGVLVHLHDIFLPDDYPAEWHWRGYNEQLVAAALLAGGGFRPLFASHWAATRLADRLAASLIARLARFPGTPDTSLWLEKTAPAIGRLTPV